MLTDGKWREYRVDEAGGSELDLQESDAVKLLIGESGDALQCELNTGLFSAPSIQAALGSVLVVAWHGSGGNVELVPRAPVVDGQGGLIDAAQGYACDHGQYTFLYKGEAVQPEGARSMREFLLRVDGEYVGRVVAPWPHWSSDGVLGVRPLGSDLASLKVSFPSLSTEVDGDVERIQVTLKTESKSRDGDVLATDAVGVEGGVEFSGLKPGVVRVYAYSAQFGLKTRKVKLVPGRNELVLHAEKRAAKEALKLIVRWSNRIVPEGCRASFIPRKPGPVPVDVEVDVVNSGDDGGGEYGRVSVSLEPGCWNLNVYSSSSGQQYLRGRSVCTSDGIVEIELDAPPPLVPVLLSDNVPIGSSFWLDSTGRGLVKLAERARPGSVVADVPLGAEVYWVLVGPEGRITHGGLAGLILGTSDRGRKVYFASMSSSPQTSPHVVRIAGRGGRGSAALEGRAANGLGYVVLEAPPSDGAGLLVDGELTSFSSERIAPWYTTLWVHD